MTGFRCIREGNRCATELSFSESPASMLLDTSITFLMVSLPFSFSDTPSVFDSHGSPKTLTLSLRLYCSRSSVCDIECGRVFSSVNLSSCFTSFNTSSFMACTVSSDQTVTS